MNIRPYSPDQEDALQEIANVAMGQAGSSLATMLDTFVVLSVPRSRIVTVDDVGSAVAELVPQPEDATIVRQAFFNKLRGEAIVLFGKDGCRDLADLLGMDEVLDEKGDEELLLDVSNILVGAVLNGLAEQLETDFGYSAPSIMASEGSVRDLLQPEQLGWSHALLIEVNFALEARGFKCYLVILMPEESIEMMRAVLDRLLESL